jgi:hypothetical protein
MQGAAPQHDREIMGLTLCTSNAAPGKLLQVHEAPFPGFWRQRPADSRACPGLGAGANVVEKATRPEGTSVRGCYSSFPSSSIR